MTSILSAGPSSKQPYLSTYRKFRRTETASLPTTLRRMRTRRIASTLTSLSKRRSIAQTITLSSQQPRRRQNHASNLNALPNQRERSKHGKLHAANRPIAQRTSQPRRPRSDPPAGYTATTWLSSISEGFCVTPIHFSAPAKDFANHPTMSPLLK